MVVSAENNSIIEIGQILMRNARNVGLDWDYCGYMFETRDGVSSGGEIFMFHEKVRLPFRLGRDIKEVTKAFKQLRTDTHIEDDSYWIKSLFVLRKDGDLRGLFEFEDWKRWSITPENFNQAFEILVGEVYSDALES